MNRNSDFFFWIYSPIILYPIDTIIDLFDRIFKNKSNEFNYNESNSVSEKNI